jgi:hypothetical protein
MEESKLTKTQKGETCEEPNQEHIIILFNIKSISHKEFIVAGQTVNSAY